MKCDWHPRFKGERLKDPYKQWKLTDDDVKARSSWNEYVKASDEMLDKTSKKVAPWHLIGANDKDYARIEVLEVVSRRLEKHQEWMDSQTRTNKIKDLKKSLKKLDLKSQ